MAGRAGAGAGTRRRGAHPREGLSWGPEAALRGAAWVMAEMWRRGEGTEYAAIKNKRFLFLIFKLVLRPGATSGAATPPPHHLPEVEGTDNKA